jgi:cyanophycinase
VARDGNIAGIAPRRLAACLSASIWRCALVLGAMAAEMPAPHARASEEVRPAEEAIEPDGLAGALVISGGGWLPDSVKARFIGLAGGRQARLVVIPTATPGDEAEVLMAGQELLETWRAHEPAQLELLHTRERTKADAPEFAAPLEQATGAWIGGGRQTLLAAAYSGTRVEEALRKLVARGGVVGGYSAGAACMSRVMIVRGRIYELPGFGLLPGAIIDQHFLARDRKGRLLEALGKHAHLVGLGVDEGAALVVRGRKLECVGDSSVTICLAPGAGQGVHEAVLRPGEHSDMTMYRRAARDRAHSNGATSQTAHPRLANGSLVIVGGGRIPPEVTHTFIRLAGGPEALIVVLPTAGLGPPGNLAAEGRFLEQSGAKNVRVLAGRRRADVESAEFLDTLSRAGGIWFGGGRQWRFIDAYEGTRAVSAFHQVLARGGVIGGSSAGATIQGEYLVRGSPLGNEQMMAIGYERGFAFLPGTAIDQHFAQRDRFADMAALIKARPDLLGIGIDESTALVVTGQAAVVMGKHQVHFYDGRAAQPQAEPMPKSLSDAGKYDLVGRLPLDD